MYMYVYGWDGWWLVWVGMSRDKIPFLLVPSRFSFIAEQYFQNTHLETGVLRVCAHTCLHFVFAFVFAFAFQFCVCDVVVVCLLCLLCLYCFSMLGEKQH